MVKTIRKRNIHRGGSSPRTRSVRNIQRVYRGHDGRRAAKYQKSRPQLERTHKAKEFAKCVKIMIDTFKTGEEWQEFLDDKRERENL